MKYQEKLATRVSEICQNIVKQSQQPAIAFDQQGHVLLSNLAAHRIFQYNDDEMTGIHVCELFPQDVYHSQIGDLFKQPAIARQEKSISLNTYGMKKDGTSFPVSFHLGCFPSGNDHLFLKTIDYPKEEKSDNLIDTLSCIIQEEENYYARLAGIFHDELGMLLASTKANLEACENVSKSHPGFDQEHFHKAVEQLEHSIKKIRSLTNEFSTRSIESLGLSKALEKLFQDIQGESAIRIDFLAVGLEERFPLSFEQALYRIVEDLLIVGRDYAGISHLNVQLVKHSDSLILTMEMDARDFNPAQENSPNAFARMKKVETRLKNNQGEIHISTSQHNGTEVMLELALPMRS